MTKTRRDPFSNALLPRMYWKHGGYYLVDPANKWHRLAAEYTDAVTAYAVKIAAVSTDRMPSLTFAWLRDRLDGYAEKTQKEYRRECGEIDKAFVDFIPAEITPADVYAFCKQWKDKPRMANQYRSLLSILFTYGASTEWPNDNPAKNSMTFKKGRKRDRYITDEELCAIVTGALYASDDLKNRSGEMVANFIELAYETGQRVGDLLALRLSDLSDDGIFFHPSKTRNNTGVKLLIEWTPTLKACVDRCKAYGKVKSLHVVRTLDGSPFTYSGIESAWKRACERAGIEDAHIHDLKAKSLTDTDDVHEAQKRGGHATEQQTAHYRKARLVTRVKPVSGN